MGETNKQYLIFLKYQRGYLSQATGYSRGHLSRIASGARLPSEVFMGVCSYNLKEPAEELFRLIEPCAPRISLQPKQQRNQDLLESIDGLGSRLTKAEAKIKALQDELNSYR